jgi:hypothetical protein
MSGLGFNESDLNQMREMGISQDMVFSQLERFKKGFPFFRLNRPCTLGDGIHVLQSADIEPLIKVHSESARAGRTMKFVPASGAASRMFKSHLQFTHPDRPVDKTQSQNGSNKEGPVYQDFLRCMKDIKQFAFYDALKTAMSKDDLDIENLLTGEQYEPILAYILTGRGLGLAGLPKGLIPFHLYPDHTRTPFEEQMVEGEAYAKDGKGVVHLHFTVSADHKKAIKAYLDKIRDRYESGGVKYDLAFSVQKPSTDTIAADKDDRPFRGRDGRLLFRPGGHGALLENLKDIEGDIIFIKNIDNVVPDSLKPGTILNKKALGGYLVFIQKKAFEYLHVLLEGNVDVQKLGNIMEFARDKLSIFLPEELGRRPKEEKINYLVKKLNRPLRVCGMVRNEGEPGGGPFWVEGADKTLSCQIVESNQVNMTSGEQRVIWESSTHFNPVDLVCGVHDFKGRPFDLMDFTDPDTGFISNKSHEGRELKALELPGLWNGAMADWNTIFIEVPLITFNPVKTILDLLRKEHQPGKLLPEKE